MNRTESAIKILDAQGAYCGQCSREPGDSLNACRDCAAVLERYANALEEAGLLAPDVQIIRTPEELEALDPMAIVQPNLSVDYQYDVIRAESLLYVVSRWGWKDRLPAAVLATGAQVRAAREAMGKS